MQNNSIYVSFIQSNYISGDEHGNLEVLVVRSSDPHLKNNKVKHFWKDSKKENGQVAYKWNEGDELPTDFHNVIYPAGLIQSNFADGEHGNFEAVLPLENLLTGKKELWHYYRDNDAENMEWRRAQRITGERDEVAGPACIIQSDFKNGDHGNFEVVVPLKEPNGTVALYHYFHENSNIDLPWIKMQKITGNDPVAGPGCIIQSDYKPNGHGNFEVVVPLYERNGTLGLYHYYGDTSGSDLAWIRLHKITGEYPVAGPATIIQGSFTSNGHGNYEVAVPLYAANNRIELWHFFYENRGNNSHWQRAKLISASCNGNACIIQGTHKPGGNHGNFEVVLEECEQSVVNYFHPNLDVKDPWLRGSESVIIGELYPRVIRYCDKIVQLTGEFDKDRKNWNGDVNNIPNTYNQTESRFGIRGTDLGNSFKHNNKTYFLFGDTLRVDQAKEQENLDSIAFTVSMCAKNGLTLEFGKQPPLISGGENITQDGFNVPLDGFSLDDNMYVFFSSNHYEIPFGYDQMGRSLLAICTDEEQYTFWYIADFSKDKFSNVSIIQDTPAEEYGLTRSEPGLFIWGSGRYRSSDVYIAFLPYSEIKRHTQGFHRNLSAIFFSGLDANNKPMWSPWEENAVALFKSGCIGELSVRYNWFIKRFIITYNSVNPRGILLRMSQKPWGNWSDHFMLFDGWNIDDAAFLGHKGFGRFIHMGDNKEHKQDHLQDDLIPFQDRSNSFGGEYGPYQVASYTTGIENVFTKLYFTMSTWNPYQVMLMYAIIPAEGNELTKTAEEYAAFDPNCNLGCSPFKRFRSRSKRIGI